MNSAKMIPAPAKKERLICAASRNQDTAKNRSMQPTPNQSPPARKSRTAFGTAGLYFLMSITMCVKGTPFMRNNQAIESMNVSMGCDFS
jgi:hypothetical protein